VVIRVRDAFLCVLGVFVVSFGCCRKAVLWRFNPLCGKMTVNEESLCQ
jgi:hypothetical protein